MHVTHKMDEELERVLDISWHVAVFVVIQDAGPAGSLELLQHGSGVPDGVHNVDVRAPVPALRTGKSASCAGIVVRGVDVVEGAGPPVFGLGANAVGPCCDAGEVAVCGVEVEDGAELWHDGRVEVHLGNGRDDFVTCYKVVVNGKLLLGHEARTDGAPGICMWYEGSEGEEGGEMHAEYLRRRYRALASLLILTRQKKTRTR